MKATEVLPAPPAPVVRLELSREEAAMLQTACWNHDTLAAARFPGPQEAKLRLETSRVLWAIHCALRDTER